MFYFAIYNKEKIAKNKMGGFFMKIRDLQVNHLSKPCGIDGSDITLRWKLEDGSQQSAFEVEVYDVSDKENKEEIEVSRKISGSQMQYHLSQKIPYRTTGKLELL
ncbi:hypothetical protein DW996_03775 [Roseburia sp. AM51-8]|nr:hypothetical protein DW996_03775 [Roseburia sp. AM51-8]